MRRGRRSRWGRRVAWALLVLLLVVALPVVTVESACRAPVAGTRTIPTGSFGIADSGYGRPATNSVLSYPEWYIVYAYQDFASVLKQGDEHSFGYLPSIADYWTGLCAVNRAASAEGGSEINEKVMLYVIGLSFTAEMTIKGLYEDTLGWLMALIRGHEKTAEDGLAASVAADYAEFVGQWPWYQYSFWHQARHLWGEMLSAEPSLARSLERRGALGLEWSVKALYASLIGAGAGLSDTPRDIESVVSADNRDSLAAIDGVTIVRELADGKWLIQTARYDAFTKVMLALAHQGATIEEIAGNQTIFLTALVPAEKLMDWPGKVLFSDVTQSRPSWHRLGIEMRIPDLASAIRTAESQGVVIEHLYDY